MNESFDNYDNNTPLETILSGKCSDINGLEIHYLETGFENPGKPLILLLHGFPELAYTWRKTLVLLTDAGYQLVPMIKGALEELLVGTVRSNKS